VGVHGQGEALADPADHVAVAVGLGRHHERQPLVAQVTRGDQGGLQPVEHHERGLVAVADPEQVVGRDEPALAAALGPPVVAPEPDR
jgi:hypothetical protein